MTGSCASPGSISPTPPSSPPVSELRGSRLGNRRRAWQALVLELPEGWTLAGGEVRHEWHSPWLNYTLAVGVQEGRIVAKRSCEFLDRWVRAEDYPDFKRLYEEVARADRHDLVLAVR